MNDGQDFEFEITPYKKKSQKKSPPKSKHKHDFRPCVFDTDMPTYTYEHGCTYKRGFEVGTYCTICGKIGSVNMFGIDPNEPGVGKTLWRFSDEERVQLNPETRTWPLFRVGNCFKQKFVDLSNAR